MLSHYALTSKLPLSYWSYAVSTTTHIINRLPTPVLHNKFPWELLFHSKPDLYHLRTFGYTCFPLLRPNNIHKLQPHTKPCIFLGYPAYFKGYICLVPTSLRIYISKHVLFNKTEFFLFFIFPLIPLIYPLVLPLVYLHLHLLPHLTGYLFSIIYNLLKFPHLSHLTSHIL